MTRARLRTDDLNDLSSERWFVRIFNGNDLQTEEDAEWWVAVHMSTVLGVSSHTALTRLDDPTGARAAHLTGEGGR